MPHQPYLEPKQTEEPSKTSSNPSVTAAVSKPRVHLPSMRKGAIEPMKNVQRNTANLGLRLGADLTSAASASVLIAPMIAVIDRYVREGRVYPVDSARGSRQ